MPKSVQGVEPTPPTNLPPPAQATASALPKFVRQHSSSSYSESDDEAQSPQVQVYRGFCANEGDSVAQWSLSQHGMTLMRERGLPPDRALIDARKAARAILRDPVLAQQSLRRHALDSGQRSFPVRPGQPPGKSPFMSVSESPLIAADFARTRTGGEPGAQPTVVTYRVASAKLTRNPYNLNERELLAPGGLNIRHVASVEWLPPNSLDGQSLRPSDPGSPRPKTTREQGLAPSQAGSGV